MQYNWSCGSVYRRQDLCVAKNDSVHFEFLYILVGK